MLCLATGLALLILFVPLVSWASIPIPIPIRFVLLVHFTWLHFPLLSCFPLSQFHIMLWRKGARTIGTNAGCCFLSSSFSCASWNCVFSFRFVRDGPLCAPNTSIRNAWMKFQSWRFLCASFVRYNKPNINTTTIVTKRMCRRISEANSVTALSAQKAR